MPAPPELQLTIERRFCGPPDVANGGYVAGRLAEIMEHTAEVTLRKPVPLDHPLTVVPDAEGGLALVDGEEVFVEARRAEPHVALPRTVTFDQAVKAAAGFDVFRDFQYAVCFVCGTARDPGDGLRIHPGPVAKHAMVAAPWVPDTGVITEGEIVQLRYIWAALDCIGAYALHHQGATQSHLLLGRITARVYGPLALKERCVVVGWATGSEGDKHFAATAMFNGQGWPAAVAEQVWFPAPDTVPGA